MSAAEKLSDVDLIMLQDLAESGMGTAYREYRFLTDRRFRFDYAVPAAALAIEVEGGAFTQGRHTRGSGFIGDLEKYNLAAIHGWAVLRFTPQQIRTGHARDALKAWKQHRFSDGEQKHGA